MLSWIFIACPLQRRAVRRDGTDRDQMATMLCFFWVVKLKTGYLSGDLAEVLAASEEAIRGARQ
jgi:hypothetical protein